MLQALLAGVLLGLSSAPHCVAMCGPLTAFASVDARSTVSPRRAALYQTGRALGYGAVGSIVGGFGRGVRAFLPFEAEAIFSVTLALTLAVAAFRLFPRPRLVTLTRGPRRQGATTRLSAAVAGLLTRVPRQPVLLGAVSALLPCGVLASGALLAAASGGALSGASVMLGLAFGSGVALLVGAMVLGRVNLAANRPAAMAFSVLLAIGAIVLAVRPLLVSTTGSCHSTAEGDRPDATL